MKIALFDMDGTLTEPRQKMNVSILNALAELQNTGYKIGIVSGSDMDYIEEQCEILFNGNLVSLSEVFWLPCNGTKRYELTSANKKEIVYENNMREFIGDAAYKRVIQVLLDSQIAIRYGLGGQDMPLTGTFIQYRGSMINWCPIGRDAGSDDRLQWISLDAKYNIRKAMLRRLTSFPVMKDLDIKIGGDTSFDIFPHGWDKTFALNNFEQSDEIYFVGDRCTDTGNDKELYDAVQLRNSGQSFETQGPNKTIEIIQKLILEQRRQT